jgi:hypothetical protein
MEEAAAAAAEDADEVAIRIMVRDEDGPDGSDNNDSECNSIDAERDAQEHIDDGGQPHPKPKVSPSHYEWSHFFRGYYIDTSWVDSREEKFHRDSGHANQKYTGKQWASKLIRFQWQAAHEFWINPTMQGIHDKEDGIRTTRETQKLQEETPRAMHGSDHLRKYKTGICSKNR